jgi:hypothetical protein
MTDYGTDVSTFPDLDASFAVVAGPHVVGESLARRLTTPPGGLFYDSQYGFDLRNYLNEGGVPSRLPEIQAAVEREAIKDERVKDVGAAVTFDLPSATLKVTLRVTLGSGVTFSLVLAISAVTTQVFIFK